MKHLFLCTCLLCSSWTVTLTGTPHNTLQQPPAISRAESPDTIRRLAQRQDALLLRVDSLQATVRHLQQAQAASRHLASRQAQALTGLQQRGDTLQAALDSVRMAQAALRTMQTAYRQETERQLTLTRQAVTANQDLLDNRTLYISVAGISLFVLLAVACLLFIRRIRRSNTSIDEVRKAQDALRMAQAKMQEESIALDNKLLALVEKQMETTPASTSDHTMTLKMASEISRIELNLSRMDASVKGYKQLTKAVQRIKDTFLANGYEIVDMLGKPYNEGMKVIANFTLDETLPPGTQTITSITKPQVNYNGKMIQAAEITVSQNI